MRHFYCQMSAARRQQILDECNLAGRLGALRLPANVHVFGDAISDTMLVKAIDAHEAGLAERAASGSKS